MRILIIACWFGLVCGLVEGIQYLSFSVLPDSVPWELRWLGVSWEILWIAPIFNLILFLAIGASVAVLAKALRRDSLEVPAIAAMAWISFYNWLGLTGQLHQTAILALSTGLAIATYRWLRERKPAAYSFFRQSLPVIAGIVILFLGITTVGEDMREDMLVSDLPPARAGAPNVLLIVLDTLRADHLSSYGYGRQTSPNIDRFAEQGVLFEKAYASSSWTVPSHASMMTGEHPSEHGAGVERPLDEDIRTLAEELSLRGYATAGFVANTYWAGRRSGIAQGFIHYEDYFGSTVDMIARTVYGRKLGRRILPRLGYRDILGRKRASDINESFLEWLEEPGDRPFFCFLNYMDVHDPYLPPEPYKTVFSDKIDDGRFVNFIQNRFFVTKNLSSEEIQMVVDAYDSSLVYLDSEVGSLLAKLDRSGVLDNTIVIITSDHGESFGERGVFAHSNSLYLEQIHVPLIVRYPREIRGGRRVSAPVSLASIPATILDFLEPGNSDVFSGVSLKDLLTLKESGEEIWADPVLSEVAQNKNAPESWPSRKGWLKSLVDSRWQCIFYESGKVELYDLQKDPDATTDLSATPAGKSVVEDFRQELKEMLSDQEED